MRVVLACLLGCLQLQWSVQGQSSSASGGCSDGEFQCPSTGVCISERLLCNGNSDCFLGEDESVCPLQSCYLDQYSCSAGDDCVSLRRVCDGVPDCSDGSDEDSCADAAAGSLCAINEFACSVRGPCIPLAFLCNGEGNCPNGEDETRCEKPTAEVQTPAELSATAGDTITLACDAIGYPPPFVTWRKNLLPLSQDSRYNFTSRNGFGVLRIHDAGLGDAGEYHCEVISELHGSYLVQPSVTVGVTDDSPSTCIDYTDQTYPEGTYYYDVRLVGVGLASQAAADVVLVVDESGSMAMEHEWIREEVGILDNLLQRRGVGAGERDNQFALIGFGRNDPSAILGTTITGLTSAEDFVAASEELELTGAFEDGYAAIDYAISSIVTRPDTAKQMILITDEDRGVIRFDLSRSSIEDSLREAGYVLNVVVNQGFQTTLFPNTSFALGVNSEAAFLFDSEAESLFSVLNTDTVIPSGEFRFGNTFVDYVELALSLGGAAWDLNQLREQGQLARAFINAFSETKVNEVMTIFRFCFGCLCMSSAETCTLATSVQIQNCTGTFTVLESVITPERAFVKSGDEVTFECLSYSNSDNSNVSYEWSYPPELAGGVTVEGGVLVVTDADMNAEVNFTCTVVLEGSGLMNIAVSSLDIDSRCQLPDWSYLVLGDIRLVLAPHTNNLSRGADIVLLVDESGSMSEEHAWISMMTELLDQALREVDVGVTVRNQFGVVGFGDDCNEDNVFGRVLLSSTQEQFAFADNITDFTGSLNIGGRQEDGYSAINIALDSYDFRDVAKQFILITDEDRDIVAENLTRDSVRSLLEDAGIQLNAAINEEFQGDASRALGIDGQGNAYVYNPSIRSLFSILEGSGTSIPDSAYGSTNTDYTQLALELGGAAWDLSQLRQGGGVAEAFTNAFVHVKVLEIQSQLNMCMNCSCGEDGPVCNLLPSANFSFCLMTADPPAPGEVPLSVTIEGTAETTILPSETLTLTCRTNSSAVIRWTFNGGNLPSNAQVSGTGGYKSILTIDSATSSNAGVYNCLASSQSGAFSASASMQVLFYDPEQDLMLVLSPLQPAITRGNNATISCEVQSPSEISWLFNDGPLPLNSLVSMSSTVSLLTLVSVEDDNMGAYTCIANSTDRNVMNEDTAYVEVIDPRLKLLIDPDIVTAQEGMLAELVCMVDCFCPGAVPEWSRADNTPLSDLAMITTSDDDVIELGAGIISTLQFPSASVEDGGRYVCSAELDGDTITAEAYLTILAEEGLEVTILGPSQVEIEEGSTHSMVCQTNQNASSIIWTFNGTELQAQGSGLELDASGDMDALDNVVTVEVSRLRTVLSILQADGLNTGQYICTATSEMSGEVATAFVDLTVL